MQTVNGFDVYQLNFDGNVNLTNSSDFPAFQRAAAGHATDAIFLAHGFRKQTNDSTLLYARFLQTFRGQMGRPEFQEIARRKYIVGAVYWPSIAMSEIAADGSVERKIATLKGLMPDRAGALDRAQTLLSLMASNQNVQDEFTALVLSAIDSSQLDATEGLALMKQKMGSELLPRLMRSVIASAFDHEFGGDVEMDASFPLADSIAEAADQFLSLAVWYVMQNRSGIVGASGVAQAVRDIRDVNGSIKIHLVGHGLGGRLMAACSKSLAQTPMLQPDSVMMLEPMISQYGFSGNNGRGKAGFFRDVIVKNVVDGPLVATFSAQDEALGQIYSMASRVAGQDLGASCSHGAVRTVESYFQPLNSAASMKSPYIFKTGVVNCLDGSGGLIKDHWDVTNPDVGYAFASAVASTRASVLLSLGAAS